MRVDARIAVFVLVFAYGVLCHATALPAQVAAPAAVLRVHSSNGNLTFASAAPLTASPAADENAAASATQGAADPAQAQPAESERRKRLKTLTYDRRPSAILKAWAEPPVEEAKEKEAEEEKKAEPKPDDGSAPEGQEKPAGDTKPATQEKPPAPTAAAPAAKTTKAAKAAEKAKPESATAGMQAAQAAAAAAATSAAAAEKAKLQQEQAKKKQAEIEAIEKELKKLQRQVTLGQWDEVKAYFASLEKEEAKDGYGQMVRSLAASPQSEGGRQNISAAGIGNAAEQQVCSLDDLFAIAAACPHERDKDTLSKLAALLRIVQKSGVPAADIVARAEREGERPAEEQILTRRQCAQMFAVGGLLAQIEPFLPSLDEAIEDSDAEAINLLARMRIAQHSEDRKPELLEKAWAALQATLALEKADKEQHEEALKMAVELAPKIREDLGKEWLAESFTRDPQRGMKILTAIGTATSAGIQSHPHTPNDRLRALELQKEAVEGLLQAAPERAADWQQTLNLLAYAWQREAEFSRAASSSSMYGPRMRRDNYGNIFYWNEDDDSMQMNSGRQGNQAQPIVTAEVIDAGPSEAWIAALPEIAQPHFLALYAQLYLKVSEEERAFPYLERLAPTHPDVARDLANEFIRVWTKNHDPNASRRYSNPYMFMYGYERKAESIPLTRTKQERNIVELTEWVKRIRALPIKDIDESLFAEAFTTCHSTAEVYRTEAIEQVFGSVDALSAKTLAQLAQKMGGNLSGMWRSAAEQNDKKTRRKQKDIQAEVLRGYEVARGVVADGLKKYPDDWRLSLVGACLTLDENAYRQEIAPNSDYSHQQAAAIEEFHKAAELYAAKVPALREEEQSTEVYEHWFYAGLGASDLGNIDHRSTPDERQPPLIRDALAALPPEAAKFHQDRFANLLFTRMSALKPTVKFRYLKAGFEIVGDHKQAREARKLYDYYKDLVREIKLVARVDGSTSVGHEQPFGVYIELHHTREIERESGGFGRYLQNQNNSMYFSYNYGRPTQNYRDKFEEAVTAALEDNFDVLSVTFEGDDVNSRAGAEYGWRVTPYAYVLLKPRGPQVDKIPSLNLDLDFLDTSGYVVLPIPSGALSIDATAEKSERPYEKLQITQTLDERRASEGKLIVEVKATARGLVPPLDEMLDLDVAGFEVAEVEDDGVSVSRYDPESSEPKILSERLCLVSLVGLKDQTERAKTFTFPAARVGDAEVVYQRYDDADLVSVEPEVSLEKQYGTSRHPWLWGLAVVAPLSLIGYFGYRAATSRKEPDAAPRFPVPEPITPFTVLAYLRHIQHNNGLASAAHQELAASIESIERHYFADEPTPTLDLRQVAETWSTRAR